MQYAALGKSDLKVSRICMGCMGFGNAATGQHNWTVDVKQHIEANLNNRLKLMFLANSFTLFFIFTALQTHYPYELFTQL